VGPCRWRALSNMECALKVGVGDPSRYFPGRMAPPANPTSRRVPLLGVLPLLVACSSGSVGGDGKAGDGAGGAGGDGGPSAECTSAKQYFVSEVWAPVMAQICIDCHAPGGIAPAAGASFELLPPGFPGFLDANFEEVKRLSKLTYDGTPLLLLKPVGKLDHGGGQVLDPDGDQLAALETLLERLEEVDECPAGAPPSLPSVEQLNPVATLRKAALSLAARLPTPAETDAVLEDGEDALPGAIDGLLEEPAFIDRIKRLYNDVLLTDRYLSYDGHALNVLDEEDFPMSKAYYDALTDEEKASVNRAVAQEPLDLIGYIVEQNRPFTEIVTADYTVLNSATAAVYNVSPAAGSYADLGALYEGQIKSMRTDTAWPHAGVLTSPMFLERFPTTPTNRNRHRARKVLEIFLATDILQVAERPINPQAAASYINPTRDDPSCNQCHRQLDPIAGAFLKFDDNAQSSFRPDREWYPEMFPPGFGSEVIAAKDFKSAPQWLAQHIAEDPRFALATVYTLYRGLTGQEPLAYPEDPDADDQAARLQAWEAQETTFRAIGQAMVDDEFNLKTAVRLLVLSPYYRAAGVAEDASDADRLALADMGTAHLLTPESLARKIAATTGIPWNREWDDRSYLETDYSILYGGIDSDIVVTRLSHPNGIMAAVQLRLANEVSCRATAWDFLQPEAERHLFRHVTPTTTNAASVKENLRYLYAQLLGEEVAVDSAEVERAYRLFADTQEEGAAAVAADTEGRSLRWACQGRKNWLTNEDLPDDARLNEDETYVMRAWSAVLAYLLSDYRFLYE
jgi:hypothetical protein